jgi:hypothetical protein
VITPEYLDILAQKAHAVGGGLVVLGSHSLWGKRALKYAIPIGIVVAALKEFAYDAHWQEPDIRGSDLRDFTFYMIGGVIALALLKAHKHI